MFGLSRGRRCHRAEDDTGAENYPETLAVWQIRNGLNSLDLTRDQTERFRAIERSHGDVSMAEHLIYQRRRYRKGSLSDAERSVLDEQRGSGF